MRPNSHFAVIIAIGLLQSLGCASGSNDGVGPVAPTPVLLQYGENYGFIDSTMKESSTKAAHGARTVVYPNAGWDMDVPEAYADRSDWLTDHLAIAR